MLDHAAAASLANSGFVATFGVAPSLSERQCLQAIAMLETSYGFGWKGAGAGSYNMGAIIAGGSWKGDTFVARDSKPRTDGSPEWYEVKFRKYPNATAGWADLADKVYADRLSVLDAAKAGDVKGVSAALYATKYFFGTGLPSERVERHHKRVLQCLIEQCRALGEPMPGGLALPRPVLSRGDFDDDVKELQRELVAAGFPLVADGHFGAKTEEAVKAFQQARGLEADGKVGEATWAALEGDNADTERPPAPPPSEPSEGLALAARINADSLKLVQMFGGHS